MTIATNATSKTGRNSPDSDSGTLSGRGDDAFTTLGERAALGGEAPCGLALGRDRFATEECCVLAGSDYLSR